MRNRKLQEFAAPARKKISNLPSPAEASRRPALLPAHIPRVVFFFGSPCTFLSDPVCRVMFKHIIKVNVGGWWLSVGVRVGVKPFLCAFFPGGVREVFVRLLWFEFAISKLPF